MKVFLLSLLAATGQFAMGQTDSVVGIVVSDPDLDDLEMTVITADLVDDLNQLDPVTVFGPVNTAFATVDAKFLEPSWILHLQNILLFHTGLGDLIADSLSDNQQIEMLNEEILTVRITGSAVTLNGNFGSVNVIETDLNASNGVVHKINQVMLPDFVRRNIVEFLANDMEGRFSTLIDLVVTADLDETVATIDATLLAPSNEAFNALDPELLEELLNDAGKLTEVLFYHVIAGPEIYPSAALEGCNKLETVQGSNVFAKVLPFRGRVFFNYAEVFLSDALAVNGVIHGIDKVLIPPSLQFPECEGLSGVQFKICAERSRKRNKNNGDD